MLHSVVLKYIKVNWLTTQVIGPTGAYHSGSGYGSVGSLVASHIAESETTSTATTKPEDESSDESTADTLGTADVNIDTNTLFTSSGSGVVTDASTEEVEYPFSEDVGEINTEAGMSFGCSDQAFGWVWLHYCNISCFLILLGICLSFKNFESTSCIYLKVQFIKFENLTKLIPAQKRKAPSVQRLDLLGQALRLRTMEGTERLDLEQAQRSRTTVATQTLKLPPPVTTHP